MMHLTAKNEDKDVHGIVGEDFKYYMATDSYRVTDRADCLTRLCGGIASSIAPQGGLCWYIGLGTRLIGLASKWGGGIYCPVGGENVNSNCPN